MPWLLANNKDLANKIRGMSSMLWSEKQKEVNEVINML